jgi:hypothetical protein
MEKGKIIDWLSALDSEDAELVEEARSQINQRFLEGFLEEKKAVEDLKTRSYFWIII